MYPPITLEELIQLMGQLPTSGDARVVLLPRPVRRSANFNDLLDGKATAEMVQTIRFTKVNFVSQEHGHYHRWIPDIGIII
jgi:hypothetical protein